MFSMGGGPGGVTGGPSSMASNAAAGLPAADVPGELRTKVEKVLENEPEHDIPNVGKSMSGTASRSHSSASFDLTAGVSSARSPSS